MTEQFIVDDAGTLIDMETRETYDIVEEVCPLLNKLSAENKKFQQEKRALLKDEFRGLFTNYLRCCRSISEEAIITLIRGDVKKIVFMVFDENE